jgi:hypothetical protein
VKIEAPLSHAKCEVSQAFSLTAKKENNNLCIYLFVVRCCKSDSIASNDWITTNNEL